MNLRKANNKDVDLLYKWSNDELVRKQSFSSEKIPYKSHCEWFENKLKDPKSFIFIIESNNIPSGVIRFDKKEKHAVISISIDKEFRGKGLGGVYLRKGVETFFNEFDLPILAFIKKDNLASIKAFKIAGFEFIEETEVHGIKSFVYQVNK